ncbi:hypothetical protein CYCD_14490 [Tenuifilaceae bacterium CYCD]|nr:hypothetical protein CYCD_14490 [Tenuifilaceae bacterium CYCD]
MTNRKPYKQIVVSEISDEICIFHLAESKFKKEEFFVMGFAQFLEYVEYTKPKYVIIDKNNLEDPIPETLYDFFNKFGVDSLQRSGIKKVFYIDSFNCTKKCQCKNDFVEVLHFYNLETCFNYIKDNQNSINCSSLNPIAIS